MTWIKNSKKFEDFVLKVDSFEDQIEELIKGIDLTSKAVKELNFDFINLRKDLQKVKHINNDYHVGESILDHMKVVLKNVNDLTKGWDKKKRNMIRLMALLHDIAKPETFAMKGDKSTFYGHPDRGYQVAKVLLSQFTSETEELRDYLARLIKHHHDISQLAHAKTQLKDPSDVSYLKKFIRSGMATEESLRDLSTFAKADSMTPASLRASLKAIKTITEDVKAFKREQEQQEKEEERKRKEMERRLKNKKQVREVLQPFLDEKLLDQVLRAAPDISAMNTLMGRNKEYNAIKVLKEYIG
jgi:putative nucleotidyltransferase with HDIG domain